MSNAKKCKIDDEETLCAKPSQWQQLFGRRHADCDRLENALQNVSTISIGDLPAFDRDIHEQVNPTDKDVADVILQMERILFDGPNSSTNQRHFDGSFDDIGVNLEDSMDLENIHCKLFQSTSTSEIISTTFMPSIEVRSSKSSYDWSLNSESIALAFHKKLNERLVRGCFDSIISHAKKEKKRLGWIAKLVEKKRRGKTIGKSFLTWKHYIRVRKMKEALLICKVGRSTSRVFRMAFSEWKKMTQERMECEKQLHGRLRQRRIRRVFSLWLSCSHRAKRALEVGYKFLII